MEASFVSSRFLREVSEFSKAATELAKCASNVSRTAAELSEMAPKLSKAISVHYEPIMEEHKTLCSISKDFTVLSELVLGIQRPPSKLELAPQATQDFHLFPLLPVEVQTMIWEAAAWPPPCASYFETLEYLHYSHNLFNGYQGDDGLRSACKLSHEAITRVYD
ncbi:hypothetical protein CMQ_6760 [Grosmannia clavigera kw1407]|uniref:2EXR domain-containing protein n=1 Tax=Grosmannia clavigera (strain kw1407 / UAMH 11150) TaxID=655863 RepID=F0X7H9_GROCL|nr:uncharacterized protein CMQ_6760 [Grosmannia clavigera kw1407]EFX06439.1 hypothetical protein CMQ_6760 [Grosmannia clavigera kw1407]